MEVFKKAASFAGINPQDVFFAEAHATGTKVGDPIEANAIGEVFGGQHRESKLRLGAVKTNVGHLECASFMAGLIKSALMLDKGTLVPNINFQERNPDIRFDELNLQVQTDLEDFDAHGKLVAISSFGFGGSNGCCILEGYRPTAIEAAADHKFSLQGPNLFLVTAETAKAVEARITSLKESAASLHARDSTLR